MNVYQIRLGILRQTATFSPSLVFASRGCLQPALGVEVKDNVHSDTDDSLLSL